VTEYQYKGRGLIGKPLNDRLEAAAAAVGDASLTTTVVDLVDALVRIEALTALDLREVPSGPYAWAVRGRVAPSGRLHIELLSGNGVVLGVGSLPVDRLHGQGEYQVILAPQRDTDE
jgi:hypothetical protein